MGPRKMRMVADLVRGRRVGEAIVLLTHTPRAASTPLRKLLQSARDNAADLARRDSLQAQASGDPEELLISHVSVDGGPILWRWQPRAYGRAGRIRKRTCHVRVELSAR
jgi:large subunit ribosomal protein L22